MLRAIHTLVLIVLSELRLLLLRLICHLPHCNRIHHMHMLLIHWIWHAHPRVHHHILVELPLHHHALVLKHFLREGRHSSEKLRPPGYERYFILRLSIIAGFRVIVRALAIPN